MEIDLKKYQTNSIFTLSNGYYIDLQVQDNGTTIMFVKSPEGAPYFEKPLDQTIVSNSQNLKAALNSEISTLSTELNEEELSILEILLKKAIPPKKNTNSFKIIGVIVDKKGNKLEGVTINPSLITLPEESSTFPGVGSISGRREEFSSEGEGTSNLTDFGNTNFGVGSALILDPELTNEEGAFIIEYREEEKIDFSVSTLKISKEDYFIKEVGPNLVKSGEEFESPQTSLSNKFEGPTQVIDEKLVQQGDGKYRAEIDLKAPELGATVKGVAISQDREIAKKKARSKAEGKLVKEAQRQKEKEANSPPIIDSNITVVETDPPASPLTTGSNPSSPQQEESRAKIDVYDIGRIVLNPIKEDIEEKVIESKIEVQKQENKIIEQQSILNVPFEVKLAALFNTLKVKLKGLLIPYVLDLISKFGPQILNNVLNKVKDPLIDKLCPSEDRLLEILKKRNKLVKQLNNLLKVVRTISKILKVTNALILGFKVGIKALTLTSTPVTFSAQVSEGLAELKRLLEKASSTVSTLSITAATVGFFLSYILALLDMLDELILNCAQEINPETGEPTLSFEVIDDEINNFRDPTSEKEQDIVDPLTGKPFPYKGFTFEIKNDTSQNFQYPKRYAIARNVQGIQVLRSESSFASNPSILIEELKFIIDKDNLRAD
jgi:hypothetical protein